jgi:hypothetical protein
MSFVDADSQIADGLPSQTGADKRGRNIQFFIVSGVIGSILGLFGYLITTNAPPVAHSDVPPAAAASPSTTPPAAAPPFVAPSAAAPLSIDATSPVPILSDHPADSANPSGSDFVPLPRPRPARQLNRNSRRPRL